MRLLECVPNISEGRDREKITSLAEEVRKHRRVKLLDCSSDKTIIGVCILLLVNRKRLEKLPSPHDEGPRLIDMREHKEVIPAWEQWMLFVCSIQG